MLSLRRSPTSRYFTPYPVSIGLLSEVEPVQGTFFLIPQILLREEHFPEPRDRSVPQELPLSADLQPRLDHPSHFRSDIEAEGLGHDPVGPQGQLRSGEGSRREAQGRRGEVQGREACR